MAYIAQLSDLHFGREVKDVEEALTAKLQSLPLDLIIVSGDLTQRARSEEFKKARAFLDQFKTEILVIPGNHDVPLYRFHERLLAPHRRYKKWIQKDLNPAIEREDFYALGLNTTHGFTFAGGREPSSLKKCLKKMSDVSSDKLKIVVAHHPLDPYPVSDETVPTKDRIISETLRDADFDLIMTGHHHHSRVELSHKLYDQQHKPFVVSMAGTTISNRTRGEENSFHIFCYKNRELRVEVHTWSDEKRDLFLTSETKFSKSSTEWTKTGT